MKNKKKTSSACKEEAGLEKQRSGQNYKLHHCKVSLTFCAINLQLLFSGILSKFQVSNVHDGSNDLIALKLLFRKKSQDVYGFL